MYFGGVIGQEKNKKVLGFYIDYYKKFNISPHFMFVAAKGNGKTMLATKYSEHLYNESNGLKRFAPAINASNLSNVDDFWANIVLPYVDSTNSYTILIDEASELPRDISFMLLTALQPNDNNRNTVTHEGVSVDFNFNKTTFLFATTDPQRVNNALKDRLKTITLESYNSTQIQSIINNKLKSENISTNPQSLKKITNYIKYNGRSAVLISKDIISYCQLNNKSFFDEKTCKDVIELHNLKPYGLNNNDLQILQALSLKSHTKLMDLEAITGLESAAIRVEFESNLIRNGLMGRETKGRFLTAKGREYLKKYCH